MKWTHFSGIAAIYGLAVLSSVDGVTSFALAIAGLLFGSILLLWWLGMQVGKPKVSSGKRFPRETQALPQDLVCPLCRAEFEQGEVAETCEGCETVFHRACRAEWRVCSTLGCRRKKRSTHTQSKVFRVERGGSVRVRSRVTTRTKICLRSTPTGLSVTRSESDAA